MKLQTKLLTSILAVGLTVALVGGSTMAWFTDTKDVAPATFTAGTVTIHDVGTVQTSNIDVDNVNPGDNFTVSLTVHYDGTKPVYLRIKNPQSTWLAADGVTKLSSRNVEVTLPDGWTKDGNYLYYHGSIGSYQPGVIPGTAADGTIPAGNYEQRTVTITANGTIDGALTTNAYQHARLTISGGTVEVIQATNNAPWPTNASGAAIPVPAAPTATPTVAPTTTPVA